MRGSEPTTVRPALLRSPGRFFADLLLRNWGLKAIAFVLAALLFVSTRDEVTRGFTVPLRVVEDPDRVLLTELPESVQVQARGPWARVNRLQDYDFGSATLDLTKAGPGPLELDRAGIVMPPGVVLAGIKYDQVDLRFDPVVERTLPVKAQVSGSAAPDYDTLGVEVQPRELVVRGGQSTVDRVTQLLTEPVDIEGADHDLEVTRSLVPLPEGLVLMGPSQDEAPRITVHVVIGAKADSRRYTVPVAVPPELDPTGAIPRTFEVTVHGPRPDFRVLEAQPITMPVVATARPVEGPGGERMAEVTFEWAQGVPRELQGRLSWQRAPERIELPEPPGVEPSEPPPTPDGPRAP